MFSLKANPKMNFLITNYVIVVDTRSRQDLLKLLTSSGHGLYKPNTYSALVQKTDHEKNTFLIFKSGNITSMGSESLFFALRQIQEIKYKYKMDIIEILVTNMVVKYSIEMKNDIIDIYEKNKDVCLYDKSIFPCCTIHIPQSNRKANLFSSGTVIITGCKTIQQIQESIEFVHQLVQSVV